MLHHIFGKEECNALLVKGVRVGLCFMAFDQQKDHQRIFGVDFVSGSVSLNSLGTTANQIDLSHKI